jgi:hypothetical protein
MLQYFRAALYCYYSSWILYPSQFLVFLKPTDISTVVKIKSIHACCKIVKSKHCSSSHSHFLVLVQYSLFYCPQINYRPRQRIKGFHSSQLGMWIIFHSTNICHFTRTNFCNSIRFMKIPFTTLCIWYTGTYLSFNIICCTLHLWMNSCRMMSPSSHETCVIACDSKLIPYCHLVYTWQKSFLCGHFSSLLSLNVNSQTSSWLIIILIFDFGSLWSNISLLSYVWISLANMNCSCCSNFCLYCHIVWGRIFKAWF